MRTPKEILADNCRALRVLAACRREQRLATDEERQQLRLYAGWGLSDVRRLAVKWDGTPLVDELKDMSQEDLKELYRSTVNAHYTPEPLATALWRLAERWLEVDPDTARVLEPSCGAGAFLWAAPESFAGATVVAVDMDPTAAGICQLAHPGATVLARPLQDCSWAGAFDLAIGNVPFGNYAVYDAALPPTVRASVHNYFVGKCLLALRPGGILVAITSRHALDSQNDAHRLWFARWAELVAAFRLPASSHETSEVTSDVLVLRRLAEDRSAEDAARLDWVHSTAHEFTVPRQTHAYVDGTAREITVTEKVSAQVARYFLQHPEHVLGQFARDKLYWSNSVGVEPRPGDLPVHELLAAAAEQIPATERAQTPTPEQLPAVFNSPSLAAARLLAERARDAIRMRDAGSARLLRATFDAVRSLCGGSIARAGQMGGVLHPLAGSADWPLLLALELPDGQPAPLVLGDFAAVPAQEESLSPQDALLRCLDERGSVDLDRIGELAGVPPEDAVLALREEIFLAADGTWQERSTFLSGDVCAKLAAQRDYVAVDARARDGVAALEEILPPELGPGDVRVPLGAAWVPADIVWDFALALVPDRLPGYRLRDYLAGKPLDARDRPFEVAYAPAAGQWVVERPKEKYPMQSCAEAERQRWGTYRMDFWELLVLGLNLQTPVVWDTDAQGNRTKNVQETLAAQAKLIEIRERWAAWVWAPDEDALRRLAEEDASINANSRYRGDDRASALTRVAELRQLYQAHAETRSRRLCEAYNRAFGAHVPRRYDGSGITFPGLAAELRGKPLQLRAHQRSGAYRIAAGTGEDASVVAVYDVGFGKTATAVCGAVKRRQIGRCRRAVFVVPKHVVPGWRDEFLALFPGEAERLVVPGDDFSGEARRLFLARLATGNAAYVVLSYEQFTSLPISPEAGKRFLEGEIEELREHLLTSDEKDREGRLNARQFKAREKQLLHFEAKLKERFEAAKRDGAVTWDDIGADLVVIDEWQSFKNLFTPTKMTGVAGLPRSESQRAIDALAKVHGVLERGFACSLTATPLTNTVAEAHVVMKFFQPKLLRRLGLWHFDAWASVFTEPQMSVEMDAVGKFRSQTRLKFVNIPELLSLLGQSWDRADECPDVERPGIVGGRMRVVEVEGSAELRAYTAELAERAELVRARKVEPEDDNMLKITSDGRLASLHNGPDFDPRRRTKLDACADLVAEFYAETRATRSAQIVFLDLGTPRVRDDGGTGEAAPPPCLYEHLRSLLVARGIPRREIAFIHEAKSEDARRRLYARTNSGDVAVLVGSTQKMGTGVNVQERAYAVHHLDVPWRPDWLAQRTGRAQRPGNLHQEVHVVAYVTTRSYDAVLWQIVEKKAEFVAQVMSGRSGRREADDVGDMVVTAAQAKAIAVGDDSIVQRVAIETELARLATLRQSWDDQVARGRAEARKLPHEIASCTRLADALERAGLVGGDALVPPGGTELRGADAGEVVRLQASALRRGDEVALRVGRVRGWDVSVERTGVQGQGYIVVASRDGCGILNCGRATPTNELLPRILREIELAAAAAPRWRERADGLAARLRELDRRASSWPHEDRVAELWTRYHELCPQEERRKFPAIADLAPAADASPTGRPRAEAA